MVQKEEFNEDLIKSYPRSNKKMNIDISPYAIGSDEESKNEKAKTNFISPHGIEFNCQGQYIQGELLKIKIPLPDFWTRKKQFVKYSRIDDPVDFPILARVVKCEDIGKRGKKKRILVETVNIDEVDRKILQTFLQEG